MMKIRGLNKAVRKLAIVSAITVFGTAGMVGITNKAYADDDSYTMAPPVSSDNDSASPAPSTSAAASSVFNWQDIPANQQVPITRAVFDQGGYQLYDTVGETIVVPFKDQNLYVMKFGVSTTGSIYFVNSGTEPILYVPQHGYLTNATVPGARWYPFTSDFTPATPVFLGVAPSWNVFVGIGWYPDMFCYGGYWCGDEFGVFGPSFGLFISFGGHHFDGWGGYRDYAGRYGPPYHMGYYNRGIYHSAHGFGGDSFRGAGGHGFGGGHSFAGAAGHSFGGGNGGGHTFAGGSGHNFSSANGHSFGGSSGHAFRGATGGAYTSAGHGFGGGYHGTSGESHSYGSSTGGFHGSNGSSHGTYGGGSSSGGFHGASGDSHGSFGGSHNDNGSVGGGGHSGGFGGGGGGSHSDSGSVGGGGGGGDHGGGGGGDRHH
jgi:hypothetical protein